MKKIFYVLFLLFFFSILIFSNENHSNPDDEKMISASRHLRNASIGLMIPAPTLITFSFMFFGIGDICDIEYRYYEKYGFQYTNKYAGWEDFGIDTWSDFSILSYSIGGALLGVGSTFYITSLILLGNSIALDIKYGKNNTSKKKPISLWKIFLCYSIVNSIPNLFLKGITIYTVSRIYWSRRAHPFYGKNENWGIKFFVGSIISSSIFEIISFYYMLLSIFTYNDKYKEKYTKRISPILNISNANSINIGLNIKFN